MKNKRAHRSKRGPKAKSKTLDRRRAGAKGKITPDRGRPARGGSIIAAGDAVDRRVVTAGNGPTAETLSKLRPDPIILLALRGDVGREHRMAALEIRQAVIFITQPVALRLSNPARIPGSNSPLERENERNLRLKRRYLAWVDELGRHDLPTWPVFDVVIDKLSCRQSDRSRHKRSGTARRLLVETLEIYCKLSGWTVGRGRKT